jgi:hypothetical protein
MDIIKHYIHNLYNSNIVIELDDESWMRIIEDNGRYIWYNANNSQRLYFHKDSDCYRFIELSLKPNTIKEIVYNSYHGNILLYKKSSTKI